jgi:hypothetical protein
LGWLLGENNNPWSKLHPNPKLQEEIILNSIEFKPRNLPEFSFQIPSESKEDFMRKVVHLLDIFKTIFYLKFLELGKIKFRSIKV